MPDMPDKPDMPDMLDIAADFPLLVEHRTEGRNFVYLDNAATTQKPRSVVDAIVEWYTMRNANPHRGTYVLSKTATDAYEFAREVVARHIGADRGEVVFCRNATEALNLVACSFGREVLEEGDEIVLPVSEHHSNLLPWQHVARATGARLVYLYPDACGRLPDSEVEGKIGPRAKIVACAQVSNVLGTEFPLARLAARAHEAGAYAVFDCTQGLLHCGVDVRALDADFVALSAHKAFGPNGIGVLWGRRELLENMPPFLRGGETVQAVTERKARFEKPPLRFEAGTQDPAGAWGFAAALDYIECLGIDAIRRHERALTERLLRGLAGMPRLVVYGNPEPADDRTGIVSFNIAGQSPLTVAGYLDIEGVMVRAGTHCAQPLLAYLGASATCRASVAPYNTLADVDYFLDRLAAVSDKIVAVKLKGR